MGIASGTNGGQRGSISTRLGKLWLKLLCIPHGANSLALRTWISLDRRVGKIQVNSRISTTKAPQQANFTLRVYYLQLANALQEKRYHITG